MCRPGSDEVELAADFAVYRTPIREALIRLETMRIIAKVPRKGWLVTPISAQSLCEMFEFIAELEALCGSFAAKRSTPFQRQDLLLAHEACRNVNDPDEYYRLNELFHIALYRASGNPFLMDALPQGAVVADVGSGAGMDCLLAGHRVGPNGAVIGIDMTDEMLERARAGAEEAELDHVRFEKGDINKLPLESQSVDVLISNGVFNLSPDKAGLFAEAYRVVKPGGRLQFAVITVGVELSENARNDIDLWTG